VHHQHNELDWEKKRATILHFEAATPDLLTTTREEKRGKGFIRAWKKDAENSVIKPL